MPKSAFPDKKGIGVKYADKSAGQPELTAIFTEITKMPERKSLLSHKEGRPAVV